MTETSREQQENLTLQVLQEIIENRAVKKLEKDLHELFIQVSSGLLYKSISNENFPKEVNDFSNKFFVNERYFESGGTQYKIKGEYSKQLYDYWLPVYIERETKDLLSDVSSYLYYNDHPKEAC